MMSRGLRRETIKIEDWCDMSAYNEDIKFKIVNIKTDRTPNGFTVIDFVPYGDLRFEDIPMKIKMPNCMANDKRQIRVEMMEEYNKFIKGVERKENVIKIGDTI